jgi:peptidoglycan-associated lipoprotein
MKAWKPRVLAFAVAIAVITLVAGCAKKTAEAPPTPPPTVPAETPPPQPPPPVETPPPPPTPPALSTSDFEPAFFDLDSYSLRDDARGALDRAARLLRDNPTVKITVEGHCDERGTVEYNQALGERRGQAARDYLVAAGIDAARLQVISYGKERPFDLGHDESAWAKNRRAHFVMQ